LCGNNNLVSLKGAPEKVGGDFDCGGNTKSFTIEDIKAISRVERYLHQ